MTWSDRLMLGGGVLAFLLAAPAFLRASDRLDRSFARRPPAGPRDSPPRRAQPRPGSRRGGTL